MTDQSVAVGTAKPLTPSQELIWTSQRLSPDAPLANMATVTRFASTIDPDRFIAAFHRVVGATPILRSRAVDRSGRPTMVVDREPPSTTEVVDMSEAEVAGWMSQRIATPLDMARTPYDSVLLHVDSQRWVWWLNIHHLFTDAASSALIYQATAAEYHGEPLALTSLAEVTAEFEAARATDRWISAADHWAADNDGPIAETALYGPTVGGRTRSSRLTVNMDARRSGLNDLLAGPFRALTSDLALLTTMATAIATYCWRVGANESTIIGIPVHHRSSKAAKTAIGPLVELFPLTIDVEPDDTFATLHKRTSRAVMRVLANALPGTGPRQRFDVVLNVHAATFGSFGDIPATIDWHHPGHIDPHHRLRVQVLDYTGDGNLEVGLDLNHSVAEPHHRDRAADHFGAVLDAMIDDPTRPIGSFDLLNAAERQALLHDYNTSAGTESSDAPTPDAVFPATGATIPERIAKALIEAGSRPVITDASLATANVDAASSGTTSLGNTIFGAGQAATGLSATGLSGDEVAAKIDSLARWLGRQGVTTGDRVGIEMGPSIDAVIAIHAVLAAGAAFVPIDPSYPQRRREHLASDSGTVLVLDALPDLEPADEPEADEPDASLAPLPAPAPDDLAYVIYTSGSTGLPKGVPITHRGLSAYVDFALDAYIDHDDPVIPLFSSLSFDLTITSLMLPWLAGGRMTVHPEGGLAALRQIAEQAEATWCKATPSHLELLVRLVGVPGHGSDSASGSGHPLRTLVVGGESFGRPLAMALRETFGPGLRIFNEYGPTECVVGCMIHEFDPDTDLVPQVPIGRPAPAAELFILDDYDHPVPAGAVGELYVHRPGMLDHYVGDPELTAQKLRVIPHLGDRTLYRTGDRVRMVDDTTMVYLGRVDDQAKVRGVRLEPGEVEAALVEHPAIASAVVRVWTPEASTTVVNCVRCGIPSNVPGVTFDERHTCSTCHSFDTVAPQAEQWFRTEPDLVAAIEESRGRSTGDYDVLHLLSGGKDSTYALYRLVEMGARVLAVTLDNGFIAEGALSNAASATAHLGVDHEVLRTDAMNEIFRDSLDRFSNVCNGCYKTIYTLAINRADELGIGAIVTGLSRGQFFETRLVPGLFGAERFDLDSIDNMVLEARKAYHRTDDAVQRNLDVSRFETDDIFDRVTFIDFYRYVDVPLAEMFQYLESETTWARPEDTGRSTNCLINSAGIFVHKIEQGHHNYALPYSWDVLLGHKTRAEAIEELDDPMDDAEMASITRMLAEVGYEPRSPEMLTAWYTLEADAPTSSAGQPVPSPEELRAHLADRVPDHALPAAFVVADEIPLTVNGKVDTAALAPPSPVGRVLANSGRPPESAAEQMVAEIWSDVLGISGLSADDDFFALGGASLDALEMAAHLSDRLGHDLPEVLVFQNRTVAELAKVIDDTALDSSALDNTALESTASTSIDALGDTTALSVGEEALLYEWRLDPSSAQYNGGQVVNLPDTVDRNRLNDALRAVVAHQPTLHTGYGPGRPKLSIDAALRITEHPVPQAGQHPSDDSASAADLAAALNTEPFDLNRGPLVTAHHLETANGPALAIRLHHVSGDAGSMAVLWNLLARAYSGEPLPPLDLTYAQHGRWQASQTSDSDREFWLSHLTGDGQEPAELALRTESLRDRSDHRRLTVTPAQLRAAANRTPLGPVLVAVAAVLRPYHDGETVEIGLAASTRNRRELADVVGYFTNVLPLRLAPPADLSQVDDLLVEAIGHRSYPFAHMVRDARSHGVAEPTARVIVAYNEASSFTFDGTECEAEPIRSAGAVGDLAFVFTVGEDTVDVELESRAGMLDAPSAAVLLDALDALLSGEADPTPPARASGEPLGATPTAAQVLAEVASQPGQAGRPAVVCGATRLTYGEVSRAAAALAGDLTQAGVAQGDRVALLLERSALWPVAVLACWQLGASYVPIDPELPDARVTAMVEAAAPKLALHSGRPVPGSWAQLVVPPATELVERQTGDGFTSASSAASSAVSTDPDSEAYVIFTSGSTGTPKGVSISHANLGASLAARLAYYPDPVSAFLLVSALSFDSSVAGLFWTLATGGRLVIPTDDQVHDVDALLDLCRREAPSHTLCVPSLYRSLLDRDRPTAYSASALSSFQMVVVAGEACPPALVELHHTTQPDAALVNEYGPTEATVWATAAELAPPSATPSNALSNNAVSSNAVSSNAVSIGGPIPGVTAVVVDRVLEPVAPNVAGELLLAGPTLSSGYLGDPIEPAGSSPFVTLDGVRHYRTGDRVVMASDGTLTFLGRVDDQLSLGGQRVEPAEVEVLLAAVDGVREVGVVADGRRLVATVMLDNTAGPSAEAERLLAAQATTGLAAATRPGRYRFVDELPRTRTGKLDRQALAEVVAAESTAGSAADESSSGAVEAEGVLGQILGVWGEVFERPGKISTTDDFFDLGGDSLVAVELVMALEEELDRPMAIGELVEHRTPAKLHRHLTQLDQSEGWQRTSGGLVEWLQQGSREGRPLVVLPALGDLLLYRSLVANLPDELPVMGMRLPLNHKGHPLPSLHEQATILTAELRRAQPQGPYRLMGWSSGGLLAWELARQLRAAGEVVDQIVLIDTYPRPVPGAAQQAAGVNQATSRTEMVLGIPQRLAEFRERNAQTKVLASVVQRQKQRRFWRLAEESADGYVPRPMPAHTVPAEPGGLSVELAVTLVAARTTDPNHTIHPWKALHPDLEVVVVEGDHSNESDDFFLNEYHSPAVADRLRDLLRG